MAGSRAKAPIGALAILALIVAGCATDQSPGEQTASPGAPSATADGSACGELVPPQEPTSAVTIEVQIANWAAETVGDVTTAFNERYPNITVDYVPVAFDDMVPKVLSTVGEGQATPDVYIVDQPRLPGLVARDLLLDLTCLVPDLSETLIQDSVDQSSFDGKLWGLPTGESTSIVLFNRALLTEAGVALPTSETADRWTWEQVVDAAKQAQESAGAEYGIVWDQPEAYYQLAPLALSLGGGTGLTGSDLLTPDITSEGWVDAMSWYRDLHVEGVSPRLGATSTAGDEPYDLFSRGDVAFLVTGPWAPAFLSQDLDMGLMAQPYFEGGDAVTPSGAWAFGINPNTEQQDAARLFLEFISLDEEGSLLFALANGEASPNLANLAKTFETDGYAWWDESSKLADLMLEELDTTAVPRPRSIGYPEFEVTMGRAFADIRNGADVVPTLDRTTSDLDEALAPLR